MCDDFHHRLGDAGEGSITIGEKIVTSFIAIATTQSVKFKLLYKPSLQCFSPSIPFFLSD
jgi:hypothetical protein